SARRLTLSSDTSPHSPHPSSAPIHRRRGGVLVCRSFVGHLSYRAALHGGLPSRQHPADLRMPRPVAPPASAVAAARASTSKHLRSSTGRVAGLGANKSLADRRAPVRTRNRGLPLPFSHITRHSRRSAQSPKHLRNQHGII